MMSKNKVVLFAGFYTKNQSLTPISRR